MKTVFETFEYLLFNQHITKSLYNIANYFEFLHMQMSKFHDILTKNTVKDFACSLKRYIIIPPQTLFVVGYTVFTSVRPSVRDTSVFS